MARFPSTIPSSGDELGDLLGKLLQISNNSLGATGGVIETGTTAITGDFIAIHCLEDTVLASYTSSTLTGDSLAGVTLAAGTVIYGRFSAFTLTSGKVIAYNRG